VSVDPKIVDWVTGFVGASAGESPARLRYFYRGLDADGWVVELARARLRIEMRSPLSHAAWAEVLGFEGARAARSYRAAVYRPGFARAMLVDLARDALKRSGPHALRETMRSPARRRWDAARAGELKLAARRLGRHPSAVPAVGPFGQRLELDRLELGLSIKEWASKLGVAPNTYRKYLALELGRLNPKVDRVLAELADLAASFLQSLKLDVARRAELQRAATVEEVEAAVLAVDYAYQMALTADPAGFAVLEPVKLDGPQFFRNADGSGRVLSLSDEDDDDPTAG